MSILSLDSCRVLVSAVYSREPSGNRSWKYMVIDIQLHVCGPVLKLCSVRSALGGRNLGLLNFRRESTPHLPSVSSTQCSVSPPSSPELPPPTSPYSSPFRHHQPFYVSSSSPSPNKSQSSLPSHSPSYSNHQDTSPSPPPVDSDETTAEVSPSPPDSDETTAEVSPSRPDSDEITADLSPIPAQ